MLRAKLHLEAMVSDRHPDSFASSQQQQSVGEESTRAIKVSKVLGFTVAHWWKMVLLQDIATLTKTLYYSVLAFAD